MSKLYSSFTVRGLKLPNRIVVSPMCQYSATNGVANDWHLVHLGTRAVGGAGLVIAEAVAVSPEGRISPADLGIWNDEQMSALKRITTFIREQGSASGIQLAHAGRKASTAAPWEGGKQLNAQSGGWDTFAPSAIPFYEDDVAPIELTNKQIKKLVANFVSAAKKSVDAGFDVIEIHAAHGYLLNQFISPLTNHRNDEYGGSFRNRVRLLLEIVEEVRKVIPEEMPLFVRLSAEEWAEGGHTINESIEVAKLLKAKGVDLIDCSSGAVVRTQKVEVKKNYQVPFAEQIKKEAEIATGAVGLITDVHQAEKILVNNQADLIFIGRELLRNPYFPLLESDKLQAQATWPKQYQAGKSKK